MKKQVVRSHHTVLKMARHLQFFNAVMRMGYIDNATGRT